MNYRAALLFGVVLTVSIPVIAQSPSAAPTSSSEAPPPASANADPSPELIKKARREGYKPEKQKNGETLFCATDASETGTRLTSQKKKCVRPDQLDAVIEARQDQRNDLNRNRACTGSNCSGH